MTTRAPLSSSTSPIIQPPQPFVRLTHVEKHYLHHFSLQIDQLDIAPGAWIAIHGKSGAGKSTLLHLISGIDYPDSGKVILFGKDLTTYSEAALAQLRRNQLGILYQRYFFIPHLPVWQNITSKLIPEGISTVERRRRAKHILEEFKLTEVMDRSPQHLSGGEQQRAALARALINDPDLLIADEPTSHVDNETQSCILRHLQQRQASGTTILVATHDSNLLRHADTHYEIDNGKLRTS